MARKIEIEIVGDTKGLTNAFGKAADSTDSFGKSLLKVGGYAALAVGAAGIGGLAVGLKVGIAEFSEAAKVGAQTNAVLKSTGEVANVTSQQVSSLAESLMQKSGVDDEAIQSGENLLLTFTNIRDEAGKGNDIFAQATKATLDLSVAMGKDMNSSAILVGKALNDPIKGMTALGRAGVQLTEGQKKLITGFVKTGDTMSAQKIILGELTTQFGGSAEALGNTLPGQINILKESFSNLAGDMVSKLVPAFTTVVEGVSGFITKFSEAEGASEKFKVIGDAIKDIAVTAGEQLLKTFEAINWTAVAQTLITGFTGAVAKLRAAAVAADWNSIGQVSGNALVTALNKLPTFVATVNWNAVGQEIVKGYGEAIKALAEFLKGVNWADVLVGMTKGIIAVLMIQPKILLGVSKALGLAILDGIEQGLAKLVPFVKEKLAALPGALAAVAKALPGAALAAGVAIVTGVVNGLVSLRAKVLSKLGELAGVLAEVAASAFSWALQIGGEIVTGIIGGMGGLVGRLIAYIGNAIKDAVLSVDVPGFSPPEAAASKAIGQPLGQGVINGFLLGVKDLPEKMGEKLRTSLQSVRGKVEAQQAVLGEAFGNLGDYVGRQFAAKTEQQMDKITSKFDRLIAKVQTKYGAPTASEAALAGLDASEDALARKRASEAAALQLEKAQAMDEGLEKEAAIAAATEAIRLADLANLRFTLEEKAASERKAADARAAEEIKRLEASKERELQNYEERRRQMEESLDRQLESLGKRLALHPEEHDKIQKKIIKLLNSYGVPMEKSGKLLGDAFADGIRASYGNVERAVKKLAQLVADFVPHSPAKRGPLKEMPDWRNYFTAGLSQAFSGTTAAMSGGSAGFPSMAMAGATAGGRGGGGWPERITVELDRRVLAEAVRTEVMRQQARNR